MSAKLAFRCQPFVTRIGLLVSLLLGVAACGSGARCAAADDITPAQAFAAAQVAAEANSESLVSAIGVGEFTDLRQHKDDAELKLWSKAKVHVYFDRGRYHVQLVYEKQLRRSVTNDNGIRGYRIADQRFDDVRIIAADDEVHVVTFAKQIVPTCCQGTVFSRQQQPSGFATAGFPWSDPARLWMNFLDIDQF